MSDLRQRAEQHAVALCLSWAGLMFGVALVLQGISRRIDQAVTWTGGER